SPTAPLVAYSRDEIAPGKSRPGAGYSQKLTSAKSQSPVPSPQPLLRPPNFADREVVTIAGRRGVVEPHRRSRQRRQRRRPLHPVGIADRRQILMHHRLAGAEGARDWPV